MPTNNIDRLNGLLSPEGKFYDCKFTGHDELAKKLCEDVLALDLKWRHQDHLLLNLGWGKVSIEYCCDSMARNWHIYNQNYGEDWSRLTQKQRDFIFDWCQHHGVELPDKMNPESEMSLSE